MALTQNEKSLLRVSKATQKALAGYEEGIYIAASTGRGLVDLRHQACADRLLLADQFLDSGNRLFVSRPPQYRSAVSRYYYSMYHSMRAVAYFYHEGDDNEAHAKLPGATPPDFPNSNQWQNALKDARGRRNEADYDPYPISHSEFRVIARDLRSSAQSLSALCRGYLQGKGCSYA